MLEKIRIFSGNANIDLAENICRNLGVPLGKANVSMFSDGETRVEINENVRGMDVFIIQSTCPPVNITLMELLIMIDAMKRASAYRITAVMPYYGYARQDRKVAPRAPISAKLVADLITTAGANRVLSMDLHAGQIQGFFNIPVDNLFATPVLLGLHQAKLYATIASSFLPTRAAWCGPGPLPPDWVPIWPSSTSAGKGPNEAQVMNIIGNVKDKTVIILDDMIDTAGTVVQAANALKEAGALDVSVCCTHPVLSGPAIERLENSEIKEVIVTDTIPLHDGAKACSRIKVLSVAGFPERSG